MTSNEDIKHSLMSKVMSLNKYVWKKHLPEPQIKSWLENFKCRNDSNPKKCEQLHALHLLSQFMYFGDFQIRVLLKSIYHEFIKYPETQNIRADNSNTLDSSVISPKLKSVLSKYRYLGVGNPADSGCFLLYMFRQESGIPLEQFIFPEEIFEHSEEGDDVKAHLSDASITNYVFLDDVCGSGDTAVRFSKKTCSKIRQFKGDYSISYFCLFATEEGLERVRKESLFDRVEAVVTLDESFKSLSPNNRHFESQHHLDLPFCRKMSEKYGKNIYPKHPLGHKGGELLIGLSHNTPNNSLPIFWGDESNSWQPLFPRYKKGYGKGGEIKA